MSMQLIRYIGPPMTPSRSRTAWARRSSLRARRDGRVSANQAAALLLQAANWEAVEPPADDAS
jgi:hypothetical protein